MFTDALTNINCNVVQLVSFMLFFYVMSVVNILNPFFFLLVFFGVFSVFSS